MLGNACQQKHEFVASIAAGYIIWSKNGSDDVSDSTDGKIAALVSVSIVHHLQIIEVKKDDGKNAAGAQTASDLAFERFFKAWPVVQPGYRIPRCLASVFNQSADMERGSKRDIEIDRCVFPSVSPLGDIEYALEGTIGENGNRNKGSSGDFAQERVASFGHGAGDPAADLDSNGSRKSFRNSDGGADREDAFRFVAQQQTGAASLEQVDGSVEGGADRIKPGLFRLPPSARSWTLACTRGAVVHGCTGCTG